MASASRPAARRRPPHPLRLLLLCSGLPAARLVNAWLRNGQPIDFDHGYYYAERDKMTVKEVAALTGTETAELVRGSEGHVKRQRLKAERQHPELSGNLKAKKIRTVNPTSSSADTTPLRSTRSTTQNQKLNRGI